ncbi:MAG: hypothetical protein QQN63_12090 [Nitrosopumilus sp.]
MVKTLTNDEADWGILKLANRKGKFAIQMGPIPIKELELAFERGIDEEWWTLVDIGPNLAHANGTMMRVFKLTTRGIIRRIKLSLIFDNVEGSA